MKKTRIIGITVLIVAGGLALRVARAQQPGIKRTDRATGAAKPAAQRPWIFLERRGAQGQADLSLSPRAGRPSQKA